MRRRGTWPGDNEVQHGAGLGEDERCENFSQLALRAIVFGLETVN